MKNLSLSEIATFLRRFDKCFKIGKTQAEIGLGKKTERIRGLLITTAKI